MSESEAVGRRADSPRRRARAAAAAAGQPWSPDDVSGSGAASYSSYSAGSGGYPAGGAPNSYEANGYGSNNYAANGYGSEGYAPQQPASGGYSPGGYSSEASAPNGYSGPGYAGQGYPGQGYAADGYAPQGPASNGYTPQGPASNGYAPQEPASNGYAALGYASNGYGPGSSGGYAAESYPASAQPAAPTSSPYAAFTEERSPYAGSAPAASSSPYAQAAATTTTRSPYEDVLASPAAAPAPTLISPPAAPPSPMNGSPITYRPETYERTSVPDSPSAPPARPPRGYEQGGYEQGGYEQGGYSGGTDLDQPWPGSSAPPRRRDRPAPGYPDDDGPGRSRRGPAGRSDRSRPGRSAAAGGASGAFAAVAAKVGLGGRSAPETKRRPEPATPLQAAISAGTEIVVVLGMALALSLVIKTFLVQAFFIPSQSMQDTLQIGDRVLVSKLTPGPFSLNRGDVIVFKDPGGWLEAQPEQPQSPIRKALTATLTFVGLLPQDSGEHLIKRVIGLPGDTVECCDAQGKVTVNGTAIDETYVRAGNTPSTKKFKVTIPADRLWVMGDNRDQSLDSRFHQELDLGTVPMKNVVGKAFVIVWPFSHADGIGVPPAVFARVPDPAPAGSP